MYTRKHNNSVFFSFKFGDTLLHISVRLGFDDACQALLDCGAIVEAKDKVSENMNE